MAFFPEAGSEPCPEIPLTFNILSLDSYLVSPSGNLSCSFSIFGY
jgi:hypothetical protein